MADFDRFALRMLLALLFVCATLSAKAQDPKVVFVQVEKVYRESALIQQIRANIEEEFKLREEEVVKILEEIREKRNRLNKEGLTLGADEKEELRQDIDRLERVLTREDKALREDRNLRFSEYREKLEPRILRVIGQIAQAHNYEIVLDFVLFGKTNANITDEVIKLLDEQVTVDSLE